MLDFYCPSRRLALELDGGQHFDGRGVARDAERTAYLARRGIRVVRFTNLELLLEGEDVLAAIWEAIDGGRERP